MAPLSQDPLRTGLTTSPSVRTVLESTQTLDGRDLPVPGCQGGCDNISQSYHHRRQSQRVGGHPRGPRRQVTMGRRPENRPHHYLEVMAVFLVLRHFEPLIWSCHILVRTGNTATLCYINKQGGLASQPLNLLARGLTLWCDTRLASIRAFHVPGLQNSGADLLSRGRFWYTDWSLHPEVANQVWERFGRPSVDLFVSQVNTKCPLVFLESRGEHPWPWTPSLTPGPRTCFMLSLCWN